MRTFVKAAAASNAPAGLPRSKPSTNTKRLALLLATGVALLGVCVGAALASASPTVSTGSATDVGDNAAGLQASVVPAGAQTTYFFQYGPTSALGTQTATASAGSGTTSKAVTATIAGLIPGTTYYYRIDASNSSGSATGATKSFRSAGNPPPGATTGAAQSVTADSVTLTGVVYPQGQTTSYYFRYGPTLAYGLQTAAVAISAGTAPVTVTSEIPGLEQGLTFHYQLVAVHLDQGPTAGADASFETFPAPAPKPTVTSSTTPRAILGRPYTFLTSGRIVNPSSTPASLACVGTAQITLGYGHRTVASALAQIQPDCTYAAAVTLRHLPGHGRKGRVIKLGVYVHFSGGDYLAAAGAKKTTVRLS